MDLWGIFMVFLFMFIIFSCCGYCCTKKRRGAVLSAPIVVTSATHTAPGGYPVAQMPVGSTTTTTTAYQTHMYAAPYPPQGAPTQMPMPMPQGQQYPGPGVQPYMAPYPQMPSAAANMNPPSYDMAVGGAGAGVANNASYEKQAPYNPNYSQQ